MGQPIIFDIRQLTQLKKAYNKAVVAGAEEFIFEGNVVVVAYAKYLIEYLETKLNKNK